MTTPTPPTPGRIVHALTLLRDSLDARLDAIS